MRFLRWITTPPDRSLQHLAMTARCCDHLTTIQAPENPWNVQVFHWHWCTQVRSLQEWCDYSRTQQQSSCFEMASVRHRHHFEWRLGQNSSGVGCKSRNLRSQFVWNGDLWRCPGHQRGEQPCFDWIMATQRPTSGGNKTHSLLTILLWN